MTDDEDQWTPLEIGEDEIETFTALREDVTPWLEPSLAGWISVRFTTDKSSMYPGFNSELARKCERTLRVRIEDDGPHSHSKGMQALSYFMSGLSLNQLWRFVDFLLSDLWRGSDEIKKLNGYLLEAGSVWCVGTRQGKPGLLRRMPDGVKVAAEAAMQKPNAGKRLAAAWEEAYGVTPDPSNAYALAVKAVEDASIPVVPTGKAEPTLGDVIRTIDGGTWRLPHLREHNLAPTHDVLVAMLRTLWRGHHDRHGGPSTVGVPAVTQEEAESAVLLAVTLVGLFETGKVQP